MINGAIDGYLINTKDEWCDDGACVGAMVNDDGGGFMMKDDGVCLCMHACMCAYVHVRKYECMNVCMCLYIEQTLLWQAASALENDSSS
jgi:hypothetical protein